MQTSRRLLFLVLVISLVVTWVPAVAQVLITTIPTGIQPQSLAVNSATNKTYVANKCGNDSSCASNGTVTVIDGGTFTTQTVGVGFHPIAVAVDSVTNQTYVTNYDGGTVTVIDGSTLTTKTVAVGGDPSAVAVNPITNKIYVTNNSDGTVTVIDGSTLTTQTVTVGNRPGGVAANSITNKIYVTNACGNDPTCQSSGTVTAIDGVTLSTQTVTVGFYPSNPALNSVTNKIDVASCNDISCGTAGTLTVIDGVTLTTQSATVGFSPVSVAVDAVTNKAYVANECGNDPTCNSSGTVTVVDGTTLSTSPVTVGVRPLAAAVDPVTNKIYVANRCGSDLTCQSSGTVTAIDGTTNSTTSVGVGHYPGTVALNPVTNRVYVPSVQDNTVSVIAGAANSVPLQFVSLMPPCRLVDTRGTNGEFGGPPLQAQQTRSFTIPDNKNCNIPSSAAAYSVNVTVVPQGPLGYLTVWPTGEDQPNVSTLNSPDGRTKANAAIVPAGYKGAIDFYVTNTTDLVLDIDGYFAPVSNSTLAFYPLAPCRVADTRDSNEPQGLGPPSLTGGVQRDFPLLESMCGIPLNGALAYSLNFTAIPHGPLGYLTVWPTGESQPYVSTLNAPTGTVTANAAIVPAGTGGAISTYATNDTDLAIDINGYFAAAGSGGLSLYTAAPCRVLDTRPHPFQFELNPPVDVLNSVCAPSSQSQAYVFNATVVPQGPLDYLTLWPDGSQKPLVSTLNAYDVAITSNMAIVPAGKTNGKIDAYANPVNQGDPNDVTNLILDISSYFAP